MSHRARRPHLARCGLLTLLSATLAASADAADWPQFGGPTRDFVAPAATPAAWPDSGPTIVWERPLGEGYSSVAVFGERLYTMYRAGEHEVVVALAADGAEEVWSHAYEAPIPDYMERDRGLGPHATPLVTDERIFTVGVGGALLALERESGELLWRRDLVTELGGTTDIRGYPASALAYDDLVILPVGGEGQSLVAFRQSDGEIVWRSGDFDNSMSSPRLVELGGATQVVSLLEGVVAGFDPGAGDPLWHHPHAAHRGIRSIVIPIPLDGERLFVSTQHGGSAVLGVASSDGGYAVEEHWSTNQVRFHFTSPLRLGDVVYGSSGDFGPVPMTAISLATGEVLWRDRSFQRANLVQVGRRSLLLDEDGALGLVTLTPEGLEVHAKTELLDELAWTPPTVVRNRVYVRTRARILALELPELVVESGG